MGTIRGRGPGSAAGLLRKRLKTVRIIGREPRADPAATALFDRAYATRENYFGSRPREEFVRILDAVRLPQGEVLDLGAGDGRYALCLARRGFAVTAVDVAREGLRRIQAAAAREGLALRCVLEDLCGYRIPPESCALITASTVLDHLPPASRRRLARTMVEGLKPGGAVFASAFTRKDPGYLKRTLGPGAPGLQGYGVSELDRCIQDYYAEGELRDEFTGLDILHYAEPFEADLSHGPPHHHGYAVLFARRPGGVDAA